MPSTNPIARRKFLQTAAALTALTGTTLCVGADQARGSTSEAEQDRWKETIDKGLLWLASQQGRSGGWTHAMYSTAVTSLAGTALICSGATTTQGPYAKEIRNCVDFLMSKARRNGPVSYTHLTLPTKA